MHTSLIHLPKPALEYRRIIGLAVLFFTFVLGMYAQTPIVHYPLNGNANDAGSNGLNGTIIGTLTPTADRFGNANSAMLFDGNPANRIEIADNALLRPGSVTLMAWVKLNNQSSIQSIIDKPLNMCTNDSWHFATEGGNYSGWVNTGAAGCADLVQMTTPNIAGVWRHVAFVVDADNDVRKLYVNGFEMASASYGQSILYDSNPVFIGGCKENNAPDFAMNGAIDEAKIFGSALTQAQIQAQFEAGNPTPVAAVPIVHYQLNGNANDAGTNSLNGTIIGTVTPVADRFGNANGAMQFDGNAANRIEIADNVLLRPASITLMAWVKINSQTGLSSFIDKPLSPCINDSWHFGTDNGNVYSTWISASTSCGDLTQITSPLSVGVWKHIAYTMDEAYDLITYYIDGIVVGTKNFTGNIAYDANPVMLGAALENDGLNFPLNGVLDDVKIFNSALTPGQIRLESSVSVSTGLVAYYPFTGNANDEIGTNEGTVNGATLTTDRFGNANSAYSFDGVDDFIGLDHNFGPFPELTVSAWYKVTAASPDLQAIVSSDLSGEWMHLQTATGFAADNAVYFTGGGNTLLSHPQAVLNQWRQVTITAKSGEAKLYIDGVLTDSDIPVFTSVTAADVLRIGSGFQNGRFFNGSIDEVKIYNTALSAAEVLADFQSPNSGTQQKPGSGNALSLDGVDDVIIAPTTGYTGIQSYTVECWVKKNNLVSEEHIWESTTMSSPSLESNGENGYNFWVDNSSPLSTGPLNVGQWYHIACVYNQAAGLQQVFVNGISKSSSFIGVSDAFGPSISIGARSAQAPFRNFSGSLDEFRVWNTALTQTQIRDRMCRKITSGDALFSNLVAYYNFDESNGNSVFDGTGNNNTGTLTNGPSRVTSGAAIGNASAHGYVSTGFPNATLTFNGQDNLFVNYVAGSFSGTAGTHVYVVNEKPNTETGIENPGTNDRYFGVFSAGMTNPTYNATYNYTGNPFVTAGNENQLALFKRNDNAATSWSPANATLNASANTLTVTGQSTEYMLGEESCVPPPTPTITSGGQTSFCENESLSLLSSAATGNQWSRNGADIPGATSNTLVVSTAGTYAVRVTDGSCATTSADLVLTTKPIPTVSISASSPAICEGLAVTLSTTGTTLAGREWLSNGSTTNQFGTTFLASTAGNYSVIGTAANGCKTTSAAFNLQVDATPVLSSNKPANTICSGIPIVLTSSPGASFLWSNAATTSSITVSPSTNTEFSVRTTGALGCVFDDTIQVVVVPSLIPGAVTNMQPENGSINQENTINFSWQPGANVISYDLFVWPTGQARPANPNTVVVGGISVTLNNLLFGTQYNYQVVSRSACLATDGPLQTFTTRNLPDLVVSNVQSQASLGTPGTLTVTYTVTNNGTGVSLPGSWKDRLFLSPDSGVGTDQILSTRNNVNALAPGASYNGSFQVSTSLVGTRFVFVQTDADGEVLENNETNNITFRNPGQVTFVQADPAPDLVGVGEAFAPANAVGDGAAVVTYRVLNQGNQNASGTRPFFGCTPNNNCPNDVDLTWEDNLYISPSPVFDGQARFVGRLTINPRFSRFRSERVCGVCNSYYTHEPFLPIDSSMVVSFLQLPSIPHDYSGPAYYHIRMNEGGFGGLGTEIITENNGIVSNQFNVILRPPADLEVSNVTVSPSSSQQGNQVKVKYRVTNIGANSPKSFELPFTDKVYLSTTSVLNKATAMVLYSRNFVAGSFEPNQLYTDSVTFQVPFLSTTPLFVFVETDAGNSVFEHTFEANNTSAGVQLNLDLGKKPDYVPSAITAASSIQAGSSLAVSYSVSNTGNANGVGDVSLSYYLKLVGTSGLGTPLFSSPLQAIAQGSSRPIATNVAIPLGLTPGNYIISIVVDEANHQPELNETNNTNTKTIAISASPAFDLVLTSVSVPATIDIFQNQPSFQVGGQASYSLIQNGPGIPTVVSGLILVRKDLGSATLFEKAFSLSFPSGIPATFTIPAQTIQRNTVPEGDFIVVMKLSTDVPGMETNATNNQVTESTFFTASPKPDVVFQTAPASLTLTSGASFSIPLEIKNTGVNELTGKVVSRAFLSNSPTTANVSGIVLGSSFSIPGITSMPTNAVVRDTIRGFIPLSVAGNYFLQIELEADRNTWEGAAGEANNIITIPLAVSAPVLPDLRPDALTLPANIEAGRTLSFNYVMRNIGAGSFSGTPKNTFRVSKLGVFNPSTDGETGVDQSFFSLNAGANTTLPGKMVVTGLLPGAYKPGVFANSNFAALESNFTNNEVYAAATRNVFINPLNLDVTASENNFSGDYFYRSVTVGAGLDLLAEFEGVEAYASKGKVPTASVSEFASAEDGTKQLLIPNSEAGQYFLGVVPNATGTTSLKVKALPFSILSVSPNKVGQGNATTEIKGAVFTPNTLFLLVNGSGTVVDTGTIRNLRNTMQARVTFHCGSLALGFYTVRAIKPNLDTFDLVNGLQVLPKSPSGLISTSNIPDQAAKAAKLPLTFRFVNSGNTDVENAFGRVSFAQFNTIKNVVVSPGAEGLESLLEKSGVYDLSQPVTHELLDLFRILPVWKRNVAPGESFELSFTVDKYAAVFDLSFSETALELSDEQFYGMMANEIEKIRGLSIQKQNEITEARILDSLGGFWSFQRLAFENFQNSGWFSTEDMAHIKALSYYPSMYQDGTMKGFGVVPSSFDGYVQSSLAYICEAPLSEYNLPADNNLFMDYTAEGAFVTFTSNFKRTAQDVIQSACNGDSVEFKRRLAFTEVNGKSILVGDLKTGYVYGPLIYLNLFGKYTPNAPGSRPGKNGHPNTQASGGGFDGAEAMRNLGEWLFPDPPPKPKTPPPPPPPAVSPPPPASQPDPTPSLEDLAPEDYKRPDAFCANVAAPTCKVIQTGPKKVRCGQFYTFCTFTFCSGGAESSACFPNAPFAKEKCMRLIISCDPNEIVGPEGVGFSKFIAKKDSAQYTILFENDPKFAEAAASTVRIIQPLDSNFQENSVKMESFGFDNREFPLANSGNSFSTQIDLSTDRGILVNVLGTLDIVNKQLFWQFTTVDAATGQPSVDPEKGFLPVNDSTGKGEGYVRYKILPGFGTQTGDSLRAQAEIFFDFNEPIKTNRHWNVVDALPPTTSVSTSSITQADTIVNLAWTVADDEGGSGADSTFILVQKDGGAIEPLVGFQADTGQVDIPDFENGHSYGFYFRSRDLVGNLEELPTEPQVTITIGEPCNVPTPTVVVLGSTTFCQGDSAILKSSISAGSLWSTGETTPSIVVKTGGSYTVRQIVEACTSAVSEVVVIVVNPLPAKPVLTPAGSIDLCQGGSVTISTNAAAGHRWSTGSTLSSIFVNTSTTVADTAKALGCRNVSDPLTITVHPLPVVNAGVDVSIEPGQATNLMALGAAMYQWSPLVSITPPNGVGAVVSVNPIQTTEYTVTGTDAHGCTASDVVRVSVTGGSGPLTAPIISPPTGSYAEPPTVTITTTSPGAEIYYTTSGNIPVVGTGFTRLYTGPFKLLQSATVRAMAVKTGQANSPVSVSFITVATPGICATPVFSPAGGAFEGSVTFTLSTLTADAQIYYATGGFLPRLDVPNGYTKLYTGPVTLFGNNTVRAMAVKTGLTNSGYATANYVVNNPAIVATPTFSPLPGNFGGAQNITLSTSTPNAQIYYTTNGNVPVLDVPNGFTKLYTGPFLLSKNATVRAIAVRTGWQQSGTAVGIYTFGGARSAVAGIDGDLNEIGELLVFPNPSSSGIFHLVLPESQSGTTEYSLLGIDGKTIETGVLKPGTPETLDLSQHPAGLYHLKMRMNNRVEIRRLSRL